MLVLGGWMLDLYTPNNIVSGNFAVFKLGFRLWLESAQTVQQLQISCPLSFFNCAPFAQNNHKSNLKKGLRCFSWCLPAAVSCGIPQAAGNGSFHANRYTVNSQVSYQCSPGYHPDPDIPMTAVCLEDGSWSNTAAPPRCLREYFFKSQSLLRRFFLCTWWHTWGILVLLVLRKRAVSQSMQILYKKLSFLVIFFSDP